MEGDSPRQVLTRAERRYLNNRVQLDNGNTGIVIAAYERIQDHKVETICRIALDNGRLTADFADALQVMD